MNDSEDLNLDATQKREASNSLSRSDDTVAKGMSDTYCWLLVPYIDRAVDMKTVVWESVRISGGSESIVAKAAKKMIQNEALITKWAPALLLMELDSVLWKDTNHINIKKLWDYLCTYCYLPRLANYSVLEDAIRTGVNSTEYFALAAGVTDDRFIDLKYNQYVGMIDKSAYLVKIVDALKQMAADKNGEQPPVQPYTPILPPQPGVNPPPEVPPQPPIDIDPPQPKANTSKHFFLSAHLDNTRINRDVQRLVEEVIQHLTTQDGCAVEITLEVSATSNDGFSQPVVRTVSENCRTLKVNDFGFEN